MLWPAVHWPVVSLLHMLPHNADSTVQRASRSSPANPAYRIKTMEQERLKEAAGDKLDKEEKRRRKK